LISILEEFLSLEKIEEGKVDAKPHIFSLKELANKICSELKSIAKPEQKINCTYEGEELVHLDPVIIQHILTNLTSNAIKYSPDNSVITVATKVSNSMVIFCVKDHGIGISEEDQKHLFERFYRASNVTNIQGTGLGLHIIKRYVEMMNGNIQVKSEVGKGSEFIVELRIDD
jgi:signal transduction histidine kinase